MSPREERYAAWKAKPGRSTLVALLEASQDRIYAICRGVLRDSHEAEEAAQETFLKIVLEIGRVRDGEHYERWSGQVAHRTALDRQRSLRRRKVREQESARFGRNGSGSWSAVHEAIQSLSPEDQQLIQERYFECLTLEEMGSGRGLSDVGIRKRIQKAKERLRRILSGVFLGSLVMKAKAAVLAAVVLLALAGLVIRIRISGAPAESSETLRTSGSTSEIAPIPATETARAAEKSGASAPAQDRRAWTLEKLGAFADIARRYNESVGGHWGSAATPEAQELAQALQVLREHAAGSLANLPWAMFDPLALAEHLNSHDSELSRWKLHDLLKAFVEAETLSEEAASGPVLSALLPMARGTNTDKALFLKLAQNVRHVNRELGDACFELLRDAAPHLREEAARALSFHARDGRLRTVIVNRASELRPVIEGNDSASSLLAYQAMTVAATQESDEYLVRQLELNASPGPMLQRAELLVRLAPRIIDSHGPRVQELLRQALDHREVLHLPAIRLAIRLHASEGAEALRYHASKIPLHEIQARRGLETVLELFLRGEPQAVRDLLDRAVRLEKVGIEMLREIPVLASQSQSR